MLLSDNHPLSHLKHDLVAFLYLMHLDIVQVFLQCVFCEVSLNLNGNGIFVCVKYRFLKIKLSRQCFTMDFGFLKQCLCRFFFSLGFCSS